MDLNFSRSRASHSLHPPGPHSPGVQTGGETNLVFALEEYLLILEARRYAHETLRSRRWAIGEFIKYAKRHAITDARQVTGSFLRAYLAHMRDSVHSGGKKYTSGVIANFSVSLRVFFKHLAGRGLLLFDPAADLPEIKYAQTLARVLTAAQAERVLSLPDIESPDGIRDRAILELLYSSGIRRAELSSLCLADIRAESGTVYVRQGKGRKDRVVPIGARALEWISKYVRDARPVFLSRGMLGQDSDVLFVSSRGHAMNPNMVTSICAGYLRTGGIEKGSAHIFRHTCVTEMLSNGADIVHVQEILGHTDAETSLIYTHISPVRLKEKYTRSHPAAFREIPEAQMQVRTPASVARCMPRDVSRKAAAAPRSSLEKSIAAYLEFRKPEIAERSLEAFGLYLSSFAGWCFDKSILKVSQLARAVLESYQMHLSSRKKKTGETISIKTQKYEMEVVCAFCRWCFRQGMLLYDPSTAIVLPRVGVSLGADFLSREEVELVLSLPDVRYPYGLRDRAILEVLYASGIRASELAALKLEDADYERDSLRIHAAKHGKNRVIPVSSRAMKMVYRYVHEARDQFVRLEDPGYIFLTARGSPIAERVTLRAICLRYLKAAGLVKREAVHIFRHTCAAHMLENGADLRTIQEFLGHRCLRSTRVYAHLSIKKLKEVHSQTHPAELRFLEKMRRTEEEALAMDSSSCATEADNAGETA